MNFQPPLEGLSDYQIGERARMVHTLAKLREEWQKAVNDGSLLKIETPVGLLLADIAEKLELNTQECHVFLGRRLISEVNGFMKTRINRKKPL